MACVHSHGQHAQSVMSARAGTAEQRRQALSTWKNVTRNRALLRKPPGRLKPPRETGALQLFVGGGQPDYFQGHVNATVQTKGDAALSTC